MKNKTATKRQSQRGSKRGSKRPSKVIPLKRRAKHDHINEVYCIAGIAFSIILIVAMYGRLFGMEGGALSNTVHSVFTGMIGIGGFFAPFLLIAICIYSLLNKGMYLRASNIVMFLALFICGISFAHMLTADTNVEYMSFLDYLQTNYDNGAIYNGGLLGAAFGNILLNTLGNFGSFVVIITAVIVLLILITNSSFVELIRGITEYFRELFDSRRGAEYYEEEEYEEEYEDEYEVEYEEVRPKKSSVRSRSNLEYIPQSNGMQTTRAHKTNKPSTLTIEREAAKTKVSKVLLVQDDGGMVKNSISLSTPNKKITDVITLSEYRRGASREEIESNIEDFDLEEGTEEYRPHHKETRDVAWRKSKEIPADRSYEKQEDESDLVFYETMDMPKDELDSDYYKDREEVFVPNPSSSRSEKYGNTEHLEKKQSEKELFKAEMLQKFRASKNEPVRNHMEEKEVQRKEIYEKNSLLSEQEAVHKQASIPLEYEFPPIDFLNPNTQTSSAHSKAQILENSRKLEETLKSFGVEAKVVEVSKGPTVTRYELSPGQGVKVSKISGLADDLALNLAAAGIRIEAPIPGKSVVGIEVPNKEVTPVLLREVVEDETFSSFPSKVSFALGKDIAGNTVVADIAKMPHMLIAGATGSGKSVCINTLITSIIYKARPDEVKFLMIDPKVVELSIYNGIPHLLIPVVTEPKKAAGTLNWAVQEMIARYNHFAENMVRDLKGYNAILEERGEPILPQIVIIIDELADLMMVAPGEVEDAICRLAQMARAAGLHLIIATQRPSVDVITGLIKANIPSRLAFAVSSGTDSRTILDTVGAEKLLGKGDMLFYPVGMSKPQRVQGAFISDKEVEKIVNFLRNNSYCHYDQEMIDKITTYKSSNEAGGDVDEFFDEAVRFVIGKEKASASMLQRQFRIGYNRASRLIDDLAAKGVISPEDGSKPRKILMTMSQWEENNN